MDLYEINKLDDDDYFTGQLLGTICLYHAYDDGLVLLWNDRTARWNYFNDQKELDDAKAEGRI
jgi:hypothetical protein